MNLVYPFKRTLLNSKKENLLICTATGMNLKLILLNENRQYKILFKFYEIVDNVDLSVVIEIKDQWLFHQRRRGMGQLGERNAFGILHMFNNQTQTMVMASHNCQNIFNCMITYMQFVVIIIPQTTLKLQNDV